MYVFHKLYEQCLDPECVGDKCPEMEEGQELTVKKKHSWRKTGHRASKYLVREEIFRRTVTSFPPRVFLLYSQFLAFFHLWTFITNAFRIQTLLVKLMKNIH